MKFYSYVSTKAGYDPVKTIFLCVPNKYVTTDNTVKKFCFENKWIQQVENEGAILIAPILKDGWNNAPLSMLMDLYIENKNSFKSKNGKYIPGRDGLLWLWEPLIYLVGYQEGAEYSGNAIVSNPGFFAGSALIDGTVSDFSAANKLTDKWLVPNAKAYHNKNNEIASAIWLIGEETDFSKAETYFKSANGSIVQKLNSKVDYMNLSQEIISTFFNKVVRWKNAPDGTLKKHIGRDAFYNSGKYLHDFVFVNDIKYPYAVYLPEGKSKLDCIDYPVVISLHGRGEPAWIFATKNGWEDLADELQEFVVIIPDSPENIWDIKRDSDFIPELVNDLIIKWKFNNERIYLTGFSNGALFTNWAASKYPQLFAAASPWNGPRIDQFKGLGFEGELYAKDFKEKNFKIPFWLCVGDSDEKADSNREDEVETLLEVNNCGNQYEIWNSDNHYKEELGYTEGHRLTTKVYSNDNGIFMTCLTIVKNLPHGAIYDQSRAAWFFMKQYRRLKNSKEITIIE